MSEVSIAGCGKWCYDKSNKGLCNIVLEDYFNVTTDELLGRVKELKYAVIAAETPELGKKVEEMAKRYGVAPTEEVV